MGPKSQRPPLPAPTESTIGDNDPSPPQLDDLTTNISMRSDHTSYSIPDNGEPITIPTGKKSKSSAASQASLLIEYFEGGKSGDKGRPSVRVKVTPSGKSRQAGDAVHITEVGNNRKISHTRRISLGNTSDSRAVTNSDASQEDEFRNQKHRPLEVEILPNPSDMSSGASRSKAIPMTSDVSSMPGDSVLDRPLGFKEPPKSSRHGYSSVDSRADEASTIDAVPVIRRRRSRSLSRERIEKRAVNKARELEESPEESSRRRLRKSKDGASSKGRSEDDHSHHSRRSSRSHSHRDGGEYRSGTESSLLRPRDVDSSLSGLSRSSIANNPRLLQTVEDAIRRMILPEINEIKRQQSVHQSRSSRNVRDSTVTDTTMRTGSGTGTGTDLDRPISKHREGTSREIDGNLGESSKLKKVRRSSKEGTTEGRNRRVSEGSSSREAERERERSKAKSSSSRRSSKESKETEGLTTAALRSHNARSQERERRERRKIRSKSHSRSDSIAHTDEEYYEKSKIPPMPLQSTIEDSDLTRESLLSAETDQTTTERPTSRHRQVASPVQSPVMRDISRGLPIETSIARETTKPQASRDIAPGSKTPMGISSPRSVPSRASLKSAKSDRSISHKARDAGLIGAGLGGAAAGLYYGAHKNERSRSRGLSRKASEEREISPVQSEGSDRGPDIYKSHPHDGVQRADTISSMGEGDRANTMPSMGAQEVQQFSRDIHSPASTASGRQYPMTQKRHQAVSMEKEDEIIDPHLSHGNSTRDFERVNQNRDSVQTDDSYGYAGDYDSQRNSRALGDHELRQSYVESIEEHTDDDKVFSAQEVRVIATNPQHVKNPVLAQSETGSLMEPSIVGTPRSGGTPNESFSAQSYKAREQTQENSGLRNVMLSDEANESKSRWSLLRENAQARSGSKETLDSPTGGKTRNLWANEGVQLGASSLPLLHDPLPDMGHYNNDADSITNPSIKSKPSSVHEGPLGGPTANRGDHWPYEPTPPAERRGGWIDNDEDEQYIRAGNAALLGAAAGLGFAAARNGTDGSRDLQQPSGAIYQEPPFSSSTSKPLTPGNLKDEGYITADQREPYSPLDMDKSPPILFDPKSRSYERDMVDVDDPFTDDDKKTRQLSNNSNGLTTGYYDAATGAGINNIQSQDIVALMDHLAVRDGQRSARDTQIIHNLVKSAAETRTNFQEVRQLILTQSSANLKNQDSNADKLLDRIRAGGPRPQVLGSPRTPGSAEDMPSKKPNLFKRALKGLSSKSTSDVSRIEDMLVQLLGEIESLKAAQVGMEQRPAESSTGPTRTSMDTFERMHRGPESGYEPEGQAGTGSTPGNSGYFSPQSRNLTNQPRTNQGRSSEKRVSTVPEDDEEEDRELQTPTQEHYRQLSGNYATTPVRQSHDVDNLEQSPQTARSSEEKRNRRSTFSYPRMSRWSKTTASSGTDPRLSFDTTNRAERPDSMASQSGEAINVLPPPGVWNVPEDDRLRSSGSLAREQNNLAASPIHGRDPNENSLARPLASGILEDPKYTAQRNSLTLQHPQPRPGPTGRHRNHLESQAYDYDTDDARSTDSLDRDQALLGSVPALGRLPGVGLPSSRLSGLPAGPLSPLASPRVAVSQTGPPRPPKIRDDGPLVPPKIAITPQQDRHPHIDRETYGPRGSYSTTSSQMSEEDESMQDMESRRAPSEVDSAEFELSPPFERKRSPYMPGGPLAPIEERYSMEGDRASIAYSLSQRSRRQSIDTPNNSAPVGPGSGSHSRRESGAFGSQGGGPHLAQVEEESERERSITPNLAPRAAIGAETLGGEVRKLTGPREMPAAGSAVTGGLRGTVRKKPVYSGEGLL